MNNLKKTARVTGLWYLALAIGGVVGQVLVRNELYVAGDSAATAANIVDHEVLARVGVVADLSIVVAQALVALWFFRLFRRTNAFAAGSLAAFGFVNAIVGLVGATFTVTALDAAVSGGEAAQIGLLHDLTASVWAVGALFFGLWLIPMGALVLESRFMPRALGWILVAGGVCYIASAYLQYAWPAAPDAIEGALLGVTAVGEFWMIGYLLIFGVRSSAIEATATKAAA